MNFCPARRNHLSLPPDLQNSWFQGGYREVLRAPLWKINIRDPPLRAAFCMLNGQDGLKDAFNSRLPGIRRVGTGGLARRVQQTLVFQIKTVGTRQAMSQLGGKRAYTGCQGRPASRPKHVFIAPPADGCDGRQTGVRSTHCGRRQCFPAERWTMPPGQKVRRSATNRPFAAQRWCI
jgi:hypothetical protein